VAAYTVYVPEITGTREFAVETVPGDRNSAEVVGLRPGRSYRLTVEASAPGFGRVESRPVGPFGVASK
jgi:hypothetical protein